MFTKIFNLFNEQIEIARGHYPAIAKPDDTISESLRRSFDYIHSIYKITTSLCIMFILLFGIGAFPLLSVVIYNNYNDMFYTLLLHCNLRHLFHSDILLFLSVIITLFIILGFTIYYIIVTIIRLKTYYSIKASDRHTFINTSYYYVIITLFLLLTFFLVINIINHTYQLLPVSTLNSIIYYCTFSLIITFAFLLWIFALFRITRVASYVMYRIAYKNHAYVRILEELIIILNRLHNHSDLCMYDNNIKYTIIERIDIVSKLIPKLGHMANISNMYTAEAQPLLNKAGVKFVMLSEYLYWPKKGNVNKLKKRIIEYINIFLEGNITKLPKDIEIDHKRFRRISRYTTKGKIKETAIIVANIIIPIVIYCIIINIRLGSIEDIIESISLYILVVWLIYVLIKYSTYLEPEIKEIIKNLGGRLIGGK